MSLSAMLMFFFRKNLQPLNHASTQNFLYLNNGRRISKYSRMLEQLLYGKLQFEVAQQPYNVFVRYLVCILFISYYMFCAFSQFYFESRKSRNMFRILFQTLPIRMEYYRLFIKSPSRFPSLTALLQNLLILKIQLFVNS